jgi:hypothetical protein
MHYYLCNVPNVTTLSDSTTTDMEIDMILEIDYEQSYSAITHTGLP